MSMPHHAVSQKLRIGVEEVMSRQQSGSPIAGLGGSFSFCTKESCQWT
jgi:hypothetical protein